MKIKVCGMRHKENIEDLVKLHPDYIGFIFYPKSPRYVGGVISPDILNAIPADICKTAVFVNETFENIAQIIHNNRLNAVQLHGNESPDFCRQIQQLNVEVIKAFSVDESFDFSTVEPYQTCCHYFLFDTKTPQHGGSGVKFNWHILSKYKGDKPFFLSGGISPDDAESIQKLTHPQLFALDINSKFEVEPGLKNIDMLANFIKKFKK